MSPFAIKYEVNVTLLLSLMMKKSLKFTVLSFWSVVNAVCYAAMQYRWQNDLWTVFPPYGRTGWYHFQLIHEDHYRHTHGNCYGILPYHRAAAGRICIQSCSKTAKVHAKSIGERFHSCLIIFCELKYWFFNESWRVITAYYENRRGLAPLLF